MKFGIKQVRGKESTVDGKTVPALQFMGVVCLELETAVQGLIKTECADMVKRISAAKKLSDADKVLAVKVLNKCAELGLIPDNGNQLIAYREVMGITAAKVASVGVVEML